MINLTWTFTLAGLVSLAGDRVASLHAPLAETSQQQIQRAWDEDQDAWREWQQKEPELAALEREQRWLQGDEPKEEPSTRRLPDPDVRLELQALQASAEALRGELVAWEAWARRCDEAGLPALARHIELELVHDWVGQGRPSDVRDHGLRFLAALDESTFPLHGAVLRVRIGEAYGAFRDPDRGIEILEPALEVLKRYPDSYWLSFGGGQLAYRYRSGGQGKRGALLLEQTADWADHLGHIKTSIHARASAALYYGTVGRIEELRNGILSQIRRARLHGLERVGNDLELRLADSLPSLGRLGEARSILEQLGEREDPVLELRRLSTHMRIRRVLGGSPLTADHADRLDGLEGRFQHRTRRRKWHIVRAEHRMEAGHFEAAQADIDQVLRLDGLEAMDDPHLKLIQGCILHGRMQYEQALASHWESLRFREQVRRSHRQVSLEEHFRTQAVSTRAAARSIEDLADAWRVTHNPRFGWAALAVLDASRGSSLREASRRSSPTDRTPELEVALDRVQNFAQCLGDYACLLAFSSEAKLAIRVHRGEVDLFPLPGEETLSHQVGLLQTTWTSSSTGRTKALAALAKSPVLAPLLDLPTSTDELWVLPEGPLLDAPLELWPWTPEGRQAGEDLSYVFERFTVRQATYLPTLADTPNQVDWAKAKVLLLAHTRPPHMHPLHKGEAEIAELKSLLENRIQVENPALESSVKGAEHPVQGIEVLHFLGHLVPNRNDGRRSYMLLGADTSEDGRLEVQEIQVLDLRIPLVILGGCLGSSGHRLMGESHISVGWGLLAAGAERLLVCTTRLDDDLARRFSIEFYSQLPRTQDPAIALRATRLKLMASDNPQQEKAALLGFHLWSAVR